MRALLCLRHVAPALLTLGALAACSPSGVEAPAGASSAGAASSVAGVSAADAAGALERAGRAQRAAETELIDLRLALDAEREARAAAEDRAAELGRRLAAEETRRIQRELEFIEYNRTIAGLELDRLHVDLLFRSQGLVPPGLEPPPPEPEDPVVAAERAAREARADAIQISLRALLRAEEVFGLDLLDVGELGDGYVGPVVFRLLDGRGRLSGSLAAARLRLTGSLAGRTLSIVLEDGYESHGGTRTPFAGGRRTISLPRVDPAPWIQDCPELFGPDAAGLLDDGAWDVRAVRAALNRLLSEDASGGYWQVRHVAGIVDEVLMQVHVSEYDREGRILRHGFADRMRIVQAGGSLQLVLEDGVNVRGDEKVAFVAGRFRIYLPAADPGAWRAAGLPGLGAGTANVEGAVPDSEPPEPAAAPVSATPAAGRG